MSIDLPPRALVAHRGLAETWPENTLEALRASLDAGVPFVEFDLQLTADGVPVLMHDASLLRTVGVDADVREQTLDDLAALRAGHAARFGDRYADVRIPTLAEAVDLLKVPPALSLVEVKGESVDHAGLDAVMTPVLEAIRPLAGAAVVISFVPAVLERARAAGWPVGLCLEEHEPSDRALAESLAPDLLLVDEVYLHGEADVWSGPWRTGCWEVTSAERALELLGYGVDFIESMLPEKLALDEALARAIGADRGAATGSPSDG